LRFAGVFSLEIEAATWTALRSMVAHLPKLSAERVRDELVKVLEADPAPGRSLQLYADAGALGVLYPELEALRHRTRANTMDLWTLSSAAAEELPRGRPLMRLAALLGEVPRAEAAALLMRLRFSNAEADETAYRAGAPPLPGPGDDARTYRRWLSASGPRRLAALARLELAWACAERRLGLADRHASVVASFKAAKKVLAARPPLSVGELALDGRDLIGLGLRPGPGFGRILDGLLDWVLDDPTRNRREVLGARALELAAGDEDA
jgi:tRNA nucleotidyltransferase (CCA-adding enzyme)